jgi:short subunit dehydrogenase-like uncharacterized protein
MSRIVVFGATGYTGRLTARACVDRGLRPVLAGRDPGKLQALSEELGGVEIAVADADRPETVRALVERGDVLISTVGPYGRYGEAAIAAAVESGAHYLDLSGEPPFIRRVFEEFGPAAEAANIVLLPSFGHDWVPGNLAGALALRDAGASARAVWIAYFDFIHGKRYTGAPLQLLTSGSKATMASDAPPDSYTLRDGQLADERLGRRVRKFTVDGRRMSAVSYGGTEQFALTRLAPDLDEVQVYLGWFGQMSRVMSGMMAAGAVAGRIPPVRAAQRRRFEKALQVTGQGPDSWPEHLHCRTVAVCAGDDGETVSRADVRGPHDGYLLTGQLLAWGAERLARGDYLRTGACGPVDAFGLDVLEPEMAELGLIRA